MEEFYRGFAQRAHDLAEKADPFTKRQLLDLAKRYDAQSSPGSSPGPAAGTARAPLSGPAKHTTD